MEEERDRAISEILRELCEQESVRVGDIIDQFGGRAFGALLFVFSIPNLLPLPPGSSTVLGAPLLLLTPQLALGAQGPWLPRFLDNRRLSGADLGKAFGRLIPWVERLEHVSRPRIELFFGPVGDRFIGAVCSALALVLILPIPLGNLLPALTIGFLGFALFSRDGIFAVVGYILAGVSAFLLYLAADVVMEGVRLLVNWLGAA
ncbi:MULTISPECIES: exopolysaccharide biosynthesis protein [Phenylobacterium]|uniref:Exopolysaccharide biosynthesis protein n=1 Tax=Phenylobacterium koreense TaxID=266125 RepID=A0ABV2EID8_9CAUL